MKKLILSVALAMTFSAQAQIPTSGLVARYRFDGNLNDNSGNGFHLSQVNTPVYENSGLTNGGQAINADLSGGAYYDYAGNTSTFQTQDFTYSVWVKIESLPNTYANFIENGNPSGNTVYFRLIKAGSGVFRMQAGYYKENGNSHNAEHQNMLASKIIGKWRLFTVTSELVDNNTQRTTKLYLDTTLLIASTQSAQISIQYDDTKLHIGRRVGSTTFSPHGLMNDTYIYYRALSDAEITQIFDQYPSAVTTYSVTTAASPSAGGIISGDGNYDDDATVTLTATPNAGYQFVRWTENINDVPTEVSTANPYTFTASADRNLFAEFQEEVGVNNLNTVVLGVYPNPANTILNIVSKENTTIKIVDVLGKTISTQTLTAGTNSINVSNFTKGVYFVQAGNSVVKFIKE